MPCAACFLGDTEPGPGQHAVVMIIVVRHRSGSESEARRLALPFVALLLMAIPVIFHAEQLWLFDLTPATFGPSSLRKKTLEFCFEASPRQKRR